MNVIELTNRGLYDDAMIALKCDNMDELNRINNWINKDRWSVNNDYKEKLNDDDYIDYIQSSKVFDLFLDFDAYYVDFISYYRIDLLNDNLDYFRFSWYLDALMNKNESATATRIKYRTYKPAKNENVEYKKYMNQMKTKYALSKSNSQVIVSSLKKGGE